MAAEASCVDGVVVLNGKVVRDEGTLAALRTPKLLLKSKPRGVYTTARTIGKTAILAFHEHVARLAKIWSEHAGAAEEAEMRSLLIQPLTLGMREFIARYPSADEMRITMLANRDASEGSHHGGSNVDISLFIEKLIPLPPNSMVIAEVRGSSPRVNPEIKDSQWVRDREKYEKAMSADANEVVLPDSAGRLYEGLSSNFFAVVPCESSGHTEATALQTAPNGTVLEGTLRGFVLSACAEHGVPVITTPPSISEIPKWKGAFLTSTSRLVLPISVLRLCEVDGTPEYSFGTTPPLLVRQLQHWVQEKLIANSEKIL